MQTDIFIIQIATPDHGWILLRPTNGKPYCYASAKRAWEIANICYPDLTRSIRLGGEERVRVTKVSSATYAEVFGAEPTLTEAA